jgi:4-hydroxyacetophenone monooxygenase
LNKTDSTLQTELLVQQFKNYTQGLTAKNKAKVNKKIAIIGGGISGILASAELLRAGYDVNVFEKRDSIGGTWLKNNYPGVQCDVVAPLYTYSKFQKKSENPYLNRDQIIEYLNQFTESQDLIKHIKFNCEVISTIWNKQINKWEIIFQQDNRYQLDKHYDYVILAVGQLSKPKYPNNFESQFVNNKVLHSSEFNPEVKFKDKAVTIIGSAASSSQIVTSIINDVKSLNIVSKSMNWFSYSPFYRKNYDADYVNLFNNVPFYKILFNLDTFQDSILGSLEKITKPSLRKEIQAEMISYFYREAIESEKLKLIIPDYPVGAKRILLDDGSWLSAVNNPKTSVYLDEVTSISENYVILKSGKILKTDLTICATGFEASKVYEDIHISNGSITLNSLWNGTPKTYLGILVSSFPNFFVLYGPNTNVVANSSNTFFLECQIQFIIQFLHHLESVQADKFVVKTDKVNQFQDLVDTENLKMPWAIDTVSSWYKNESGKTTQNWPFDALLYWDMTRKINPEDFEIN